MENNNINYMTKEQCSIYRNEIETLKEENKMQNNEMANVRKDLNNLTNEFIEMKTEYKTTNKMLTWVGSIGTAILISLLLSFLKLK